MRDIVRTAERVHLVSTLSRVTIQRQGLLRRRRIELPLEGLRITSDDATILLRTEDEEVYLNCPEGLAREKLLQNLGQSMIRSRSPRFLRTLQRCSARRSEPVR